MKVDQLLPQILDLPEIERERLLYEVAASLPEKSAYPDVSDEEVASRVAEIEADPDGSTLSHEEFMANIKSERDARRNKR